MPLAQPEGFLSTPPAGKGPGVLVLHPWWGLTDMTRTVCSRLSENGFVAFAPDLFHGKTAKTVAEAEALVRTHDGDRGAADVAAADSFLVERVGPGGPGLAVIGFSFGAFYALDLSAADPEHIRSVVLFYGTGPADFSRSRAEYLGHFAENDPFEPLSEVANLEAALKNAGRPVTFHTYKGLGHWFFESDRPEAFAADAAKLAWERTLVFLKRT